MGYYNLYVDCLSLHVGCFSIHVGCCSIHVVCSITLRAQILPQYSVFKLNQKREKERKIVYPVSEIAYPNSEPVQEALLHSEKP